MIADHVGNGKKPATEPSNCVSRDCRVIRSDRASGRPPGSRSQSRISRTRMHRGPRYRNRRRGQFVAIRTLPPSGRRSGRQTKGPPKRAFLRGCGRVGSRCDAGPGGGFSVKGGQPFAAGFPPPHPQPPISARAAQAADGTCVMGTKVPVRGRRMSCIPTFPESVLLETAEAWAVRLIDRTMTE
jgi:hypothetical protein